MTYLSNLQTLWSILEIVWPLLGGAISASIWLTFFYKKERRLFRNIGRPVRMFATNDINLKKEYRMLKRADLFVVGDAIETADEADFIKDDNTRLAVIGYTPDSEDFRKIYDAARKKDLPVIIYSGPARITPGDMVYIQGYSLHSIANTPLRLISDVFSVMSTYPENI